MDLQSSFVDDLLHAEDEYEVMALCYNKLLEYTQDSDVLFVAKIEHLEKDREFEPFAQEFENLRQILISYSQEINVHFNLDGTGFDIFKNRLIDELSSFQCPEQIDISRWFPVCLFYVLDALDGYISKNIGLVRDKYRTFGPLNQGRSKTNCLVYFHEQESFLSVSYAEKDGHGEFRRPLRETRILVYLLEILGSKNIRISSVLKYVHTLAECDDVKVDTFWNQILNRRTRSFMWNIRGVTEYESFSFIMEPTHFNMSKLNNPSQLDPEDIKVVLSLHNDSYRTNSNIYNHVEEKQSLLNTI